MLNVPAEDARDQTSPAPVPTHHCRCWSRLGGDVAVIIAPGIGKVEIAVETAANSRVNGDGRIAALYSRVRDAEADAWKWKGDQRPTGKAFVDLTDADIETLKQHQ